MYKSRQIAPGVHSIRCPGRGHMTAYLITGEERALLLDGGYGNEDIRPLLKTLTDLPIIAVNTHAHPDHVGCNALFGEVWIGEHEVADERPVYYPLAEYPLCEEARNAPPYRFRFLRDGEVINLGGGRELSVYELPGHSPGSIALLDKKSRLLFSGDAIIKLLLLFSNVPREICREALMRVDAQDFDDIYCGHWEKPLGRDYIKKLVYLMDHLGEAKVKYSDWLGHGRLILYSMGTDFRSPDFCTVGFWDGEHTKPPISHSP